MGDNRSLGLFAPDFFEPPCYMRHRGIGASAPRRAVLRQALAPAEIIVHAMVQPPSLLQDL